MRCPECKCEFSSALNVCPYCGYALSNGEKEVAIKQAASNPLPKEIRHESSRAVYVGDEGSYAAGFALGFFLGLIGLIIGIAIDKSETKKGALHGFLVDLVLGVVTGIIAGIVMIVLATGHF